MKSTKLFVRCLIGEPAVHRKESTAVPAALVIKVTQLENNAVGEMSGSSHTWDVTDAYFCTIYLEYIAAQLIAMI